ncbi:hypothetical protein LOD99_11053 [Oopsacas minuta]|uniref:Uncharacterized protein n=1 Tax=Oopsacas minuta TaxID=111878 RepID=A0AAV7KB39_9METZ|nr:hypothetical protein LOD99_11053 [Oopsacas minuta]
MAEISAPILVQFGLDQKLLVTLYCVIGVTGYILIVIANSDVYVIIGVALVGYQTGIAMIAGMTHITEVSLDNQRKVMSGGFGFSIRIGLFIVYFAGIWLSFRWFAVFGLFQLGGHEAMVAFSSHILENQQAMDPKVASLFYPIFLIIGAIVCILMSNDLCTEFTSSEYFHYKVYIADKYKRKDAMSNDYLLKANIAVVTI